MAGLTAPQRKLLTLAARPHGVMFDNLYRSDWQVCRRLERQGLVEKRKALVSSSYHATPAGCAALNQKATP